MESKPRLTWWGAPVEEPPLQPEKLKSVTLTIPRRHRVPGDKARSLTVWVECEVNNEK
jgi:hypothetical protein